MWLKIKNIILAHIALSVTISIIVIVGISGASYFAFQKGNSPDGTKDTTHGSSVDSCVGIVSIGTIVVEKDPAGDPESWLRFDYTTTANQALNCKYTITFYDNQKQAVRTIPNVEDTFQSPGGQIYNGYGSTPYYAGMTARVAVQ